MGQPAGDHHDDDNGRLTLRAEEALAKARNDTNNAFTSLEEILPAATPSGPLSGVPIAVKDLIDHAGRVTTAGSAFYRHEAIETAPALARLEAAGAVVIGRTGLHEFAFGFSSENPWFGPVLNPWDQSLSPGGSSGGSAAAVAAGVVPIALGTDTGGSIRVPAALCAVVGLKVTQGLIPLDGVFPLVPSLDNVGAIAASLDDLDLATAVMAGGSWPTDPGPEVTHLLVPDAWVDQAPLSPEVASSFLAFQEAAQDSGLTVEHQALSELGPSRHQAAVIGKEVARIHGAWRREGRPYGEEVGARVDAALEVADDAGAIAAGAQWRHGITRAMRTALADGAVILTPAVAAMDKQIGNDRMGENHYRTVLSWFSAPVNPTGCPALTMPISGEGRTPSIQLIGDHRSEGRLLVLARRLEQHGALGLRRLSSA